MSLIGKKAPDFKAKAVIDGKTLVEDFSLSQFEGKKHVVLFFYPKDFTFVCPTELHAFQSRLTAFEERGVEVVGCSTDTEYSHLAWLKTAKNEGGIEGITYTLLADTNKTISAAYDVLAGDYYMDEEGNWMAQGELVAYRGLFLIDKNGIVQHQVVNNMPLGRSVKETLRIIDALQHHEAHGEVCPMDWDKGEQAFKPNHTDAAEYLTRLK